MTVSFHYGNHPSFAGYCRRAWNDEGELRLNSAASDYDRRLMEDYNASEDTMRALLAHPVLDRCRPDPDAIWTVGGVRDADLVDLIVLKGLHQWRRIGRSWDYKLHLTLGYEGSIWHLYCRWEDRNQSVRPTMDISRGDYQAPVTHDGFQQQGRRRRGGRR